MRCKVYVDANILISASIFAVSEKLSVKINERFTSISIKLLDYIKINKGLGIVTYIVEDQANHNIRDAAKRQIEKDIKKVEDIKKVFGEVSRLINVCGDRIREFLQLLCKVEVDETEVYQIYEEVFSMYVDLIKTALSLPKTASTRAQHTSKRYRGTAYRAYRKQDRQRNSQLLRLIKKKPVQESDMKILSHATYLLKYYLRTEGAPYRMFLASCDYHFSPVTSGTVVSRQVTDAIDHYFGVECDFPDKIYEYLSSKS